LLWLGLIILRKKAISIMDGFNKVNNKVKENLYI